MGTYSDSFVSRKLGTLKGRALIRIDINVPLENGIIHSNNLRFKACAKYIRKYVQNGITPILIAHQGRKGDDDYIESLEQHAKTLSSFAKDVEVVYSHSLGGAETENAIKRLGKGQALLLKNLRSDDDEKTAFATDAERANCDMVKRLSKVADFFINDAPATMHRADTSLIGFRNVMPSYLGLQMEDELKVLGEMKEKIKSGVSIAIIFGGKKWEKFAYIYKLAKNPNIRILCGGVPGQSVSYVQNRKSFNKVNEDFILIDGNVETAAKLVTEFSSRIIYPVDFVLDSGEATSIDKLPEKKGVIMDIGEETLNTFFGAMEKADTIIYAGPVGRYEEGYNQTIRLVTRFMGLKTHNYTLGGNSADSMDDIGLEVAYEALGGERITSGGSGLAYLAGEDLPVIKAFSSDAQ